MSQARRLLLAPASGDLRSLAGTVVRPAIEAVLLAAVALGIGQAGWTAFAPAQAAASGADGVTPDASGASSVRLVASPFAPRRAAGDFIGLAELGAVRLVGVRMADNPLRSGAVISLSGGQQQAVLVGQDIMTGVRLDAVQADGVVVSYSGGAHRIALPAAGGPSTAQLLMGQAGPAAPTGVSFGAADQAWLASTLSDPVLDNGSIVGYRLAPGAPALLQEAGFAAGDVVTAINGAPAGEPLAAIAALGAGRAVALSVRRSAGGGDGVVRFVLPQGAASQLSAGAGLSAGLGFTP